MQLANKESKTTASRWFSGKRRLVLSSILVLSTVWLCFPVCCVLCLLQRGATPQFISVLWDRQWAPRKKGTEAVKRGPERPDPGRGLSLCLRPRMVLTWGKPEHKHTYTHTHIQPCVSVWECLHADPSRGELRPKSSWNSLWTGSRRLTTACLEGKH